MYLFLQLNKFVFFLVIPGLTKTPQSHPWQVLNSPGPRDDHGCLLHLAAMYPGGQVFVYPLMAIENGPFIVDLPIKNGDLPLKMVIYLWKMVIFHSFCVCLPEGMVFVMEDPHLDRWMIARGSWLALRHGHYAGPNRNRWFTELDSNGGSSHGELLVITRWYPNWMVHT